MVHSLVKIHCHDNELSNETVKFSLFIETVYNNNTPEWRTSGIADPRNGGPLPCEVLSKLSLTSSAYTA